jgi:hypothetical protein
MSTNPVFNQSQDYSGGIQTGIHSQGVNQSGIQSTSQA